MPLDADFLLARQPLQMQAIRLGELPMNFAHRPSLTEPRQTGDLTSITLY